MKRILHIAQSAGYGVTVYVESLIKGLRDDNTKQILLGSQYYDNARFSSIVDKLITMDMKREIGLHDFETARKCRDLIIREKPDIVYCHSSKAGIYGRLACIGTGTQVIYNPHGWAFNMRCSLPKKIFYKLAEIVLALFTDKIIVISEFEKKTTPCLIPMSKIQTIVNGIDVRHDLKLLKCGNISRAALGLDENDFVVGIIARISVQKGQDLLVEIAKQVVKEIPNAKFLMVGGKSDDVPIEEMIHSAMLDDNVIITGEVDEGVMYAKLFDVAVLTSRWEGFGLVLPEYMLAKCPIVAFDVDAISEVVENGKDGILIEKNNIDEFAKAIVSLYDNPSLRTQYGEYGYSKAINRFDIRRVCEEHLNLFDNLQSLGGG